MNFHPVLRASSPQPSPPEEEREMTGACLAPSPPLDLEERVGERRPFTIADTIERRWVASPAEMFCFGRD